jgi:hypothetical protein
MNLLARAGTDGEDPRSMDGRHVVVTGCTSLSRVQALLR